MIEAEWLGGPHDGEVMVLPDGMQMVVTAQPVITVGWVKEEQTYEETKVVNLRHPVRRFSGKTYILWQES